MEIIYACAIAFVWVQILQMPYRFKGKLNTKPFNCQVCLSGWITLFLTGFHWIAIPYMCLAMLLSVFIEGVIKKL
jgi:hypothetical protein